MILTRQDYFDAVLNDTTNEFDKIRVLLSARGFLIDVKDNEYLLSDNSHKDDAAFLNDVLNLTKIGSCENGIILIENSENYTNLFNLFLEENGPQNFEAVTCDKDWKWYKHHIYGKKVPVRCLEPFIAMYVKALSACGLSTASSCDGNHPRKSKIIVEFHGLPYRLWHGWIVENITNIGDLNWSTDYTEIRYRSENKYHIYYRLLCNANHLYENRIALRRLKRECCLWIKKKTNIICSDDEIFKNIAQLAKELFDKELKFYDV